MSDSHTLIAQIHAHIHDLNSIEKAIEFRNYLLISVSMLIQKIEDLDKNKTKSNIRIVRDDD